MRKSGLLTAYFGKVEVAIEGSFSLISKGFMVEIVGIGGNVPRQSISIWELSFQSLEMAESVFDSCFGITSEQAAKIDSAKGILKTPVEIKYEKEGSLAQ